MSLPGIFAQRKSQQALVVAFLLPIAYCLFPIPRLSQSAYVASSTFAGSGNRSG